MKQFPDSEYKHLKHMFIQTEGNLNRKRSRGCGSAGDVEMMYVVPCTN